MGVMLSTVVCNEKSPIPRDVIQGLYILISKFLKQQYRREHILLGANNIPLLE